MEVLGLVRLRVAKARKNRKHIWKHPTGCKTRGSGLRLGVKDGKVGTILVAASCHGCVSSRRGMRGKLHVWRCI